MHPATHESDPATKFLSHNRVGRILLVEDDEMVGQLIAEMLGIKGYEIVLTHDLMDTQMLPNFRFSAVISDLRLKTSDGVHVIDFVRGKVPFIPAMLISGYGARVSDLCEKRGIMDVFFLAKPFTATQLLEAVDNLVNQSTLG